jgi:hypothetical protein
VILKKLFEFQQKHYNKFIEVFWKVSRFLLGFQGMVTLANVEKIKLKSENRTILKIRKKSKNLKIKIFMS